MALAYCRSVRRAFLRDATAIDSPPQIITAFAAPSWFPVIPCRARARRLRAANNVVRRDFQEFAGFIPNTDLEHLVARSETHDRRLCAADNASKRHIVSDFLNLTPP